MIRRRASTTIVLLTPDQMVRADLKGDTVSGIWHQPRPMVDDLPTLVETALRLGGKGGRRVWVLTTDLWAQSLPVTAEATRGLSAEELERVLAFEAEPLSGLSAFESVIGHKALASDGFHRHFWVVQLPAWQLAQIEEAVEQSGSSLAGVAHPAGVPKPLIAAAQGQAWRRVELWPDNVVLLQASAGKPPEMQVLASSPAQDAWRADATEWLAAQGPAEHRSLLVSRASDRSRGLGDETDVLDLHEPATLTGWLAAWAERLTHRDPGVALVRPAVQPMSLQSQVLIATALAAVLLAGVYFFHGMVRKQLAATEAEIKKLEERATEFANFDKQIGDRRDQLAKLDGESDRLLADLDRYEAVLVAQRGRIARLLAALAEQRPEHLMVQKIEHAGGTLTITGLSLGPQPANELAVMLDQRVRTLGWRVGPPRQQAGQQRLDGNPWRFTMELVDAEVPVTATMESDSVAGSEPRQGVSR